MRELMSGFGSIVLKNLLVERAKARCFSPVVAGTESMMGSRQVEQGRLFYNFSLDTHVPADYLLRSIDRFVDLSELRRRHLCAQARLLSKDTCRQVPRSIYEGVRDMARDIARTAEGLVSRRQLKKIEMLFAHLKRILRLDRLRLRGPNGARDEFHLAATAQNLRKLSKLIPMPLPNLA
jgi:Transposase DDE domain